MKKFISSILIICILSSCFSTRYVSDEEILRNNFMKSSVDDIEYEFGEPDKISNLKNGYAYIYYSQNRIRGRKNSDAYTRISFDSNDNVRNIQSTNLIKQKKFDGGGTAIVIILGMVIPIGLLLIASAESDK